MFGYCQGGRGLFHCHNYGAAWRMSRPRVSTNPVSKQPVSRVSRNSKPVRSIRDALQKAVIEHGMCTMRAFWSTLTLSSFELQGEALFQRCGVGFAVSCGGIRKRTQIRDLSPHRWQPGPDIWGDLPCISIPIYPTQSHDDPPTMSTSNHQYHERSSFPIRTGRNEREPAND